MPNQKHLRFAFVYVALSVTAIFLVAPRFSHAAVKLGSAGSHLGDADQVTNAVPSSLTLENLAVDNSSRNSRTASVTYTATDFDRHVKQLKRLIKLKTKTRDPRARAPLFSIIIQRPFVVIGDEPREVVQRHAEQTVKWAVDRLKQDFFPYDPNVILDIWLFKDAASYENHARLFFGDEPTTPYGYYSSAHRALIMNIETGGGTLVHEIVHPFMEANFAAAPPWLNEGLGSLYEQSGETDGHIRGFINWRLPGLQRAIRANEVPSFKELTALNANAFYNDDKGINYAQSRYLCYYLQEQGVLVKFYREFHSRQQEDPTGFKTLQKVLGETNMDEFKTKWEKYVLDLR